MSVGVGGIIRGRYLCDGFLRACTLGLAVLIVATSPHYTRAQPAQDEREERGAAVSAADDVDPFDRTWFQRLTTRAERHDPPGLLAFNGFEPVLGGLWSGAGTTAGLRYQPLRLDARMHISVAARASRRGYWALEGVVGHDRDPLVRYGYARYLHLPQESFYGVGPNTPIAQRADYRRDEVLVGGLVGYAPTKSLFVGSHVSFMENRVGPGSRGTVPDVVETYSADEAPGIHPGVSYVVVGGWVEYDTRDLPPFRGYGSRFAPVQRRLQGLSLDAHRGVHLSAEVRHYEDLDGGDYGFTRLTTEAQQFVSAGRRATLALRQFGSFSLPSPGDLVPFYMMEPLGGVSSLRGFGNFRFRDLNTILLNAEVRWMIAYPLQLVAFTDAGHVFRRFANLSFDDLEASYGLGARLQLWGRTFVRFELARSREGATTYVKFGSFL